MTKLKIEMKKQNIKPDKMAEDLHVALAAVYNWMSGKTHPNCKNALKVARYLNIQPMDLFDD